MLQELTSQRHKPANLEVTGADTLIGTEIRQELIALEEVQTLT
ncbi:MAG: hypothetical protein SNJ68_07415 [Cyanobacteriota bacterium]